MTFSTRHGGIKDVVENNLCVCVCEWAARGRCEDETERMRPMVERLTHKKRGKRREKESDALKA